MALTEMLSAYRTVSDCFSFLQPFCIFDFIYFLKVLLRYNSQVIKFTHFKCNRVVVFSRFTELSSCHHYVTLGHFHYPRKEPHIH